MDDFDNNNVRPEENDKNTNNPQNPNGRVPEYSFWAENISNGVQPGNPGSYSDNPYAGGNAGLNQSGMNQGGFNPGNSNPGGFNSNGPNYNNPNPGGPNYYPGGAGTGYPNSNFNNAGQGYSHPGYHHNGSPNNAGGNYSHPNGFRQITPHPNYSQPNFSQPGHNQNGYHSGANSWQYGTDQMGNGEKKQKKERKPANKAVKFVTKAVSFGLIAAVSFVGFQQIYYAMNPDSSPDRMSKIFTEANAPNEKYKIAFTSPGKVTVGERSAVSKIVEGAMPSIVSINITGTQAVDWFGRQYNQEVEGSGSGFIVGKNEKELLIATNNHVVAGSSAIKVTFIDGKEAMAVIKGTDAVADLAVVCVDVESLEQSTLDAISVSKLGDSENTKVGQMSIAIGNALGYGQSVTVGYVSARDREVEVTDGYETNKMILLQTDAAINPGNSGGALLNLDGEVIGINTVKYASNEVEGMGYAIPISRAVPIINELMSREILKEEEQGYLGIAGDDVTEEISSYLNMPIGVYVKEVSPGGAAEKAGLLSGDIITRVDDIEITSITQLRNYVTSKRVGTYVEVTYMRKSSSEYREGRVSISLGKRPAE